jgi:general secretion pathway protein A
MYTKHFGLKKLPFENVPDPMFFFDQGNYAMVRNQISDSLKAGQGLIVTTGPIGSGKTTMSQMIKSDFSKKINIIWMAEPPDNSTALFVFIAQELGLNPSTPIINKLSKAIVLRDIWNVLLKIKSKGIKYLLMIDESHLMSNDTLNGIRLLNDFEEGSNKVIQVLLIGQEEILETISRPEMQPFKQRIAALEIIRKMDADWIHKYILHRIKMAGGRPSLFTDTGLEALVLASSTGGGIPRIINSLCDKALTMAFEREKTKVDIDDVSGAAEGMGIDKELFHYKISLRNKAQRKQIFPNKRKGSRKGFETLGKWPAHLFNMDKSILKEKRKS